MLTNRRELLQLLSVAGVTFASGLRGAEAATRGKREEDFLFLQISDLHWGYQGPANPEAATVLPKVIDLVNASGLEPDFVVFTGDLTHNTDDAAVRRRRLAEVKKLVGGLSCKKLCFLPGEHDAAADAGAAFKEAFGPSFSSFDHKGVHFVLLDNVSDRAGAVRPAQRDWLAADLAKVPKDRRVVVFTHRPLFDLAPSWEWATQDGAAVLDILMPHRNVTVFYGHIHQEHHQATEHILHHAARSLVFALPAPMSQPKKAPLPFDPAQPLHGLGYRDVARRQRPDGLVVSEHPLDGLGIAKAAPAPASDPHDSGW